MIKSFHKRRKSYHSPFFDILKESLRKVKMVLYVCNLARQNTTAKKVYKTTKFAVDRIKEMFVWYSADFFRKVVILDGNRKEWTDEDGITYVGVIPFLPGEFSH